MNERLAGQSRQLHRDDRSAAGRLLPWIARVHHLAGARHVRNSRELHPLDVTHNRDARPALLHVRQSHTLI